MEPSGQAGALSCSAEGGGEEGRRRSGAGEVLPRQEGPSVRWDVWWRAQGRARLLTRTELLPPAPATRPPPLSHPSDTDVLPPLPGTCLRPQAQVPEGSRGSCSCLTPSPNH